MENNYTNTNLKIYDYMKKDNINYPNNNALTYFSKQLVFNEFLDEIEKLAVSFKMLGVEKGDYVPICLPNIPQGVISFYALNKIGAIPNMIPVLASEDEFRHYLSEVPAKNFVMFRDFYYKVKDVIPKTTIDRTIIASPTTYIPLNELKGMSTLRNIAQACYFDAQTKFSVRNKLMSWDKLKSISDGEKNVPTENFKFDDTALLSHTGGTTGTPKSAEFTNENFNAMVEQYRVLTNLFERGDKILTVLPMFINYGLCNNIHMPLSFGIETIIVPTFDPKEAFDLFLKYKPNHFMCVAHFFEYMMNDSRFDNFDLSFVKTVTYGGAPLSPESKVKFNQFLESHGAHSVQILNGYGMTESTSSIAYEQKIIKNDIVDMNGNALNSRADDNDEYKLIQLPYTDIKIVDPETLKDVGFEKEGELCASGPVVFKGYLNNQEETNNVLKVHPDGTKWLHSGDLAVMHSNLTIDIVGKIKRIYPTMDTTNGNVAKIFPDNIENVIKTCECVKECDVECVVHKERVHVPFAFVVLNDGYEAELSIELLKQKCLELNNYSRPYNFIFLPYLPKMASEKIDHKNLEKLIPTNYNNLVEEVIYNQGHRRGK